MSRKRWFIWLAVAVVVLGAAVAGTEVVAQRRRLAKAQNRLGRSIVSVVSAAEWPPDFALTLWREGKTTSNEQSVERRELYGRIVAMLTDWCRWGSAYEIAGDYEIDIYDPSIPIFICWDDAVPSNDAMYMVLGDLVRVAHEWDGVGDLPDFYGIAERRMYEYDDRLITKRRNGESYREFTLTARSSELRARRR